MKTKHKIKPNQILISRSKEPRVLSSLRSPPKPNQSWTQKWLERRLPTKLVFKPWSKMLWDEIPMVYFKTARAILTTNFYCQIQMSEPGSPAWPFGLLQLVASEPSQPSGESLLSPQLELGGVCSSQNGPSSIQPGKTSIGHQSQLHAAQQHPRGSNFAVPAPVSAPAPFGSSTWTPKPWQDVSPGRAGNHHQRNCPRKSVSPRHLHRKVAVSASLAQLSSKVFKKQAGIQTCLWFQRNPKNKLGLTSTTFF